MRQLKKKINRYGIPFLCISLIVRERSHQQRVVVDSLEDITARKVELRPHGAAPWFCYDTKIGRWRGYINIKGLDFLLAVNTHSLLSS